MGRRTGRPDRAGRPDAGGVAVARPHQGHRPRLPADRRHQRQGRGSRRGAAAGLLDRYVGGHPMAGTAHSGWTAGDARLFAGAPWVLSVDEHVDAAGVGPGDGPGAGLRSGRGSGQVRRARRRRGEHLASAPPARRSAGGHRRRSAAGVRPGGRLVPGRHPGRGHRSGPGARDVRGQRRANCCLPWTAPWNCSITPGSRWRRRIRWPSWSRPGMPPAPDTTASRARRSSRSLSARRTGAKNWPPPVAPAG